MSDNPAVTRSAVPEIQARLQDIAGVLRQPSSLDAEAQHALGNLVEELARALEAGGLPPLELARLAETTAKLGEVLHHDQDLGIIGQARENLERAMGNAEAKAPVAVGLARKLLDALANIGI